MSPTATPEADEAIARWESVPFASAALRLFIAAAPSITGLLVVLALGRWLPPGDSILAVVAWWAGAMALASGVALATRTVVRRLTPLETLLRINIAFPGAVPSRYKMARRINASATLEERVARAEDAGRSGEAGAAAAAILELVFALGDHDTKTRGHSERTRILTDVLAEEMGLSAHDKDRLRWASLLHDVGKLSVRAETLKQARKLTDAEWEEVKAHPQAGLDLIGPLADWLGEWKDAIPHHHERWDGGGYPAGLAGTEISLAGRIVAVADAFEVMTAGRSYQTPRSMRDALVELTRCSGGQFDPTVVRAFLGIPVRRLGWVLGPSVIAWQIPLVNSLWPKLGSFLPAQPIAQVQQGVAVAALSGALVTGGIGALPAAERAGEDDIGTRTEQLHERSFLVDATSPGNRVGPLPDGESAGGAAAVTGADGADVAGTDSDVVAALTGEPGAVRAAGTSEEQSTDGRSMELASSSASGGGASLVDVEEQEKADREAEEDRLEAEEEAREDAEKAEEDRIKAEEEAEEDRIKAEEDRVKAEQEAEEDRIKAEQEAEEDRIKAEQEAEEDRIKAEEDRIKAEQEAEEDRIKAEEKARRDAEKAEEERREAEEEAEQERREAEDDDDDD